MESYCEKQGVSVGSTRFMFEDKRLNASHTAEEVFRLLYLLLTILGKLGK